MSNTEHNIPTECLGITGAVNFNKPNKGEMILTRTLEEAIQNLNIFESVEETKQRKEALIELQEFCNEWIYLKAIEHMYPESVAKTIKGKVFTFGSYRLGVNFSGADIDALLVVPKFITRDEFFSDFVKMLTENSAQAQEIHAVPNAYVPVLKMKFCQVEIDLLFAKVDQMSIPESFSLSDNSETLLRNMDERDVRSVNGVRVTDDILRLVYDKKTFRSVLKIIRIWAKRRCIYSNALGFLGGVSWAILVARVCQLWPMGAVSSLVLNFFKFWGLKWRWPSPVVLKETEDVPALYLTQWDPRVNPGDQAHLMPILTPSYPSQNSTYNVCASHRAFIVDQMQKALVLLRKIETQQRQPKDLFKPLFFFNFRHYLVVTYRCADRKQFREDTSLIESKLRLLVQFLELNQYVASAVIYLKTYDRLEKKAESDDENDKETVRRWFIGLEIKRVETSLYLVDEISRFKNFLSRVTIDVSYYRRSKLFEYLDPDDVEKIKSKIKRRISSTGGSNGSTDETSKEDSQPHNLRKRVSNESLPLVEDSVELKRRKFSGEDEKGDTQKTTDDVSSSSSVAANCSSTEDSSQVNSVSSVVSTTEKDETAPKTNRDMINGDSKQQQQQQQSPSLASN